MSDSDLLHVRPIDGSGEPTYMSQAALDRWPDTWEVIPDDVPADPAPVGEETETAPAATDAPTGKKKE